MLKLVKETTKILSEVNIWLKEFKVGMVIFFSISFDLDPCLNKPWENGK